MDINEASQTKTVNLASLNFEKHVLRAFGTALALSSGKPLNARHNLLAALLVGRSIKYGAFVKLADLLPLTELPEIEIEPISAKALQAMPLDTALADAFSVAEPFLKGEVWGRDFITIALLAVGDPSLQEIAAEAETTIEEIREQWFDFVTQDEKRRDRASWKEWRDRALLDKIMYRGPSPHIATDVWTEKDELGYKYYAYAIYRFLTHKETKPPLTISIQAPWGGGKTSLMRMIQRYLDPNAPGLSDGEEITGKEYDQNSSKKVSAAPHLTLADVSEELKLSNTKPPMLSKEQIDNISKAPKEIKERLKGGERRMTIWFNAWKYASTNQVWAGLVDSVMQQVAARLDPKDQELFWLRLHLKRVDANKIRQEVYNKITVFGRWLLTSFIILVASLIYLGIMWWMGKLDVGTGVGGFLAALVSAFTFVGAYWKKRGGEREPASWNLSKYLDIPDYRGNLGFIHLMEKDLRRVLECVPNKYPHKYRPLVIFIDDLDRCSPSKVAQVLEGVNLFLAGDIPDCIFVMGMDTEMVAAALQANHKDMIAFLPDDSAIPMGWRFMDKFVQLPILIPPPDRNTIDSYSRSLFRSERQESGDSETAALSQEIINRLHQKSQPVDLTQATVEEEIGLLRQERGLKEEQAAWLWDHFKPEVIQKTYTRLETGIENFYDNPEIRKVLEEATSYFPNNPRELKRFINCLRFHYFIWWAYKAQGYEGAELNQLGRWTVLSMCWPDVVRWLRRHRGSDWNPAELSRLQMLEEVGGIAKDLKDWQNLIQVNMRLDPKKLSWLNSDDLFQFFKNEANQPKGTRLSDGEGKGLW